jgi:excisionase family DNA binding protein
MESVMAGPVTKHTIAEAERELARRGASLLERGSGFAHGGLFLSQAEGEPVLIEMPASVLDALQNVLATIAETGEALVFSPEDEVSPEKAAEILGVSRPIVYQRMDTGRLPFRQVGTHRRIRATDIATLRQFEERRRTFAKALSADTEDLEENHARPGQSTP